MAWIYRLYASRGVDLFLQAGRYFFYVPDNSIPICKFCDAHNYSDRYLEPTPTMVMVLRYSDLEPKMNPDLNRDPDLDSIWTGESESVLLS